MEIVVARFSEADLEQTKRIMNVIYTKGLTGVAQVTRHGPGNATNTHDMNDNSFRKHEAETNGTPIAVNEFKAKGTDAIATEKNEKNATCSLFNSRAVPSKYARVILAYPQIIGASSTDYCNFDNLLHFSPLSR